MMKRITWTLAILAAVCSAVPLRAGEDAVRNCTWCHGTSGRGYSIAPRLAGQRAAYTENQLRSFHIHARDNPFSQQYMWGAAANLDRRTARDLSIYFSTISPQPANNGDPQLAPIGRAIYEEGIPEANIVSCVACHGPNGEGIGRIPRLAGLSYPYLRRRLDQWGEGYHLSAEPPMPRIASKLPPDAIDALASYLSFVE